MRTIHAMHSRVMCGCIVVLSVVSVVSLYHTMYLTPPGRAGATSRCRLGITCGPRAAGHRTVHKHESDATGLQSSILHKHKLIDLASIKPNATVKLDRTQSTIFHKHKLIDLTSKSATDYYPKNWIPVADAAPPVAERREMQDGNGDVISVPAAVDIPNTKLVQKQLLRMLSIMDSISQRHNVSYWVCAGTLLGTIRHSGFIPFDNDIDIGMNLEDYATFRRFAPEILPEDLWLQDSQRDRLYPRNSVYAKIRDLHSDYSEWSKNHKVWHNGLQIDIFIPGQSCPARSSCCINTIKSSQQIHRHKFEHILVNVPVRAEHILTEQYGDWARLPEVSKRVSHQGRVEFVTPGWVMGLYPHLYRKDSPEIRTSGDKTMYNSDDIL